MDWAMPNWLTGLLGGTPPSMPMGPVAPGSKPLPDVLGMLQSAPGDVSSTTSRDGAKRDYAAALRQAQAGMAQRQPQGQMMSEWFGPRRIR